MDLNGTHQPIDHVNIIAIIRYIHHIYIKILLHSILGIPFRLALDTVIDLVKCRLVYLEINQDFILQVDPSGKGLPGVANDDIFSTESDRFSSNVLPLSSPLQFTISDGTIPPVSQNNYSSNLVVTNNSFQ